MLTMRSLLRAAGSRAIARDGTGCWAHRGSPRRHGGALLLLPITQQTPQSKPLSRVVATADGEHFYNLLLDSAADTAGFQGIVTAPGPTASGKVIRARAMTAGQQRYALTLRTT